MARHRYGIGTHPLRDDPLDRYISSQNDLSVGRTLDHALRALDRVKSRPVRAYAAVWIEEAEDINLAISAHCLRNGDWRLSQGMACDGQLEERRRRATALFEHLESVHGAYEEVIRLSRQRGKYWDDRDLDTLTLFTTLRAFLQTGGTLLIHPEPNYGPILKADLGLLYPSTSAPSSPSVVARREQHMMASREALGLERRWRTHRRLSRIARKLGQRLDNGWHVLAAKAAAEQVSA